MQYKLKIEKHNRITYIAQRTKRKVAYNSRGKNSQPCVITHILVLNQPTVCSSLYFGKKFKAFQLAAWC